MMSAGCPDGSQPVICLVDPCEYASCPAITSATCVADYCGGCNARWYVKDLEVTHVCGKCFCNNSSYDANYNVISLYMMVLVINHVLF